MSAPDGPSPEVVQRVILKLYDYRDAHRLRIRGPLQAGTEIEQAFNITGDDIWEMLEFLAADLGMHIENLNGSRHFGQESNLLRRAEPFEPLTPLIIARHLRPGPAPALPKA